MKKASEASKASLYEIKSARYIRNDIHRRRTEYAEKRRLRKLAKEKAEKRKKKDKEENKIDVVKNEVTVDTEESDVGVDSNVNLSKLIEKNADNDNVMKTKRTLKREQENANKLWRNFDRYGLEGEANPEFSAYYKVQLQRDIISEAEWETFSNCMAQELPVTFRLNCHRYPLISKSLKHRMQNEFQFKGKFVKVDEKVLSGNILKSLDWSEDSNVWQVNASRIGFSKSEVLKPLHEIVSRECQLGHMARQGCASMLPAIALKVKGEHVVLDLCAAPGSKTEQVLGLMSGGGDGFLISNDPDPKRIEHMTRRFKDIGLSKLLITELRGEDLCANIARARNYLPAGERAAVFDRIICDVPCTGDGTVRKMAYLWRRWRARRALLIHPLQLQLALSAASLLKVGGRMVYSTCSLNPIENEAVVNSVLKATNGALRLVPSEIPNGFRGRPGLSTWEIREEVLLPETSDHHKKKKRKKSKRAKKLHEDSLSAAKVLDTMHPPKNTDIKKLNLNLCRRILPHDNDTGGFFVAVFEKVKNWSITPDDENGTLSNSVSANAALKVLQDSGYNARTGGEAVDPLNLHPLPDSKKRIVVEQYNLQKNVGDNLWINKSADASPESDDDAEEDDDIYMVSSKMSEALKSWAIDIPKMKAGAAVLTEPLENNYILHPIGIDEFLPNLGFFRYPIDLKNFQSLLGMIEEVVSSSTDESQHITILLEWLFDLFTNSSGIELNEALLDVPVGQSFALVLETSWSEIQQSKINEAESDTKEGDNMKQTGKRLSKAERKRLKKRKAKSPASIENSKSRVGKMNSPGSSKTKANDIMGKMVLLLQRQSEENLIVLTPIEIMESYDDVLSQ